MTHDAPLELRKEFEHLPVMISEVVEGLKPTPGDILVDVTLGGGGHAAVMLEAIAPAGKFIGIDRDEDAIEAAKSKLSSYDCEHKLIHGRMGDIEAILEREGIDGVDGILADLGVSSFQFDEASRGFSIRNNGPLDMRMDANFGRSARDIIRDEDAGELERIFREYGEERYAGRIARAVAGRDIETTGELAREIERLQPGKARRQRIHPATRVFQALRIAVNDELGELRKFIDSAPKMLKSGGRLVVISYHSLEDRMVKRALRNLASSGEYSLPRRKTTKPSEDEISKNPRARSAKLRTLVRE